MVKVKVTCSFCGNEIERKESQVAKNISGKFFCDNDCRIGHEKKYGNWNRGKNILRAYRRPPEALSVAE